MPSLGNPEPVIREEYAEDLPSPSMGGAFREDTASIIERIDPFIIAERLRHMLLAERYDENKQQWIAIEGQEPFMNKLGAAKISSLFAAEVNSNASLSNLTDLDINRIMITFGDTLADLMTFRFQEFEIKISEVQTIFQIIVDNAFFCLKRALREGERKFLKTSVRSHETIRVGNEEERNRRNSRRWRI